MVFHKGRRKAVGNPGKSYPIRTAQPIMIWPVNKLLVNFVRTNFLPKMHRKSWTEKKIC